MRICATCATQKELSEFNKYPEGYYRRVCKLCRNRSQAANCNRRGARLRDMVLDAYGGQCECCAETLREFLTIDHLGNWAHLTRVPHGQGLYKLLKKNGFPRNGYRLLCYNCNLSIGRYGYCPHRPSEIVLKARDVKTIPEGVHIL